jgi:heptosyltransferase III
MRIILSRTDSIGDVVLTLPLAGALRRSFPGCKIIFLGSEYTRPVVELCQHVDEFISWPLLAPRQMQRAEKGVLAGLHADVIIHVFPVPEICKAARRAGIPLRIATSGRFFTWFTCNRLVHVPRRNSDLHESQLNLRMMKPLGVDRDFSLEEIAGMYGFPEEIAADRQLPTDRNIADRRHWVILHPKSKGSAREWGLENFSKLVGLLPEDKFKILITGTKEEGSLMADFLENHRNRVTDMTGKLTLAELISLIASADALVAASTGPLHLAAALGKRAIGLFAPMRPIFPQRWAPVGKNATYLVLDKTCNDCRKSKDCACIRSITPEAVLSGLLSGW